MITERMNRENKEIMCAYIMKDRRGNDYYEEEEMDYDSDIITPDINLLIAWYSFIMLLMTVSSLRI